MTLSTTDKILLRVALALLCLWLAAQAAHTIQATLFPYHPTKTGW